MNEEMRKEFEEWIISNNKSTAIPNFIMKNDNGIYIDHNTALLWIGWQASREAMKPIKLPKKFLTVIDNECHYYNTAIEECENAIQQAGYKVAP